MNQGFNKDSEMGGHGGNLLAFGKRYHKREDEIIDFSSNVSPLGIPESLHSVYQASINDLSLYPDPYAEFFRETVADFFHLSSENVIAGNGSIALLEVAIQFLHPKKALLVEPCFTEYRRLLKLYGSKVDHVLLLPNRDFQFSLGAILKCLSGTNLLVLGHPNNPTGSALNLDEIDHVLEKARKIGIFVIMDEAFVDWEPQRSVVNRVRNSEHLLVVRSMTKLFALAGIRSGFALGPKKLIDRMRNYLGPWNCNRLAQKLSVAALSDLAFQEKSRDWLRHERAWFTQAIKELEEFQVFPSLANFFLIRSTQPLVGFYEFLGEKGIYVRSTEDFLSLDDSYFRIAIRTRAENQRLMEALSQWVYAKKKERQKQAPAFF